MGRFVPQLGLEAEFLGSLFMNMIQMVIVPLIFPLIVLVIVEMSQAQRFGGLAIKSFILLFRRDNRFDYADFSDWCCKWSRECFLQLYERFISYKWPSLCT